MMQNNETLKQTTFTKRDLSHLVSTSTSGVPTGIRLPDLPSTSFLSLGSTSS